MSEKLFFPKEFLWGTSTSSYQVEGGINNCDWSEKFPAGRACDHYNRYEKDFDLMEGFNAYRFSIEWSRIEPEEGKFDADEIDHYGKILTSLKKRRIKAMVTLHHFTSPVWFSRKGGWAGSKSVFYFSRYAEKMISKYGDLVDFWITVNEPMIYTSKSFLKGDWPPFDRNVLSFKRAVASQISAHKKIFGMFPEARIGIAKNNQAFEPFSEESFWDRFSSSAADHFWNEYFLDKVGGHSAFIGLNYYFHNKIKFPFMIKNENNSVSDLGWEIYPEGIRNVLAELHEYGLPIYVTENGLADKEDKIRKDFIRDHLIWIHRAIEEGVDVRGYFHWSLMDNFEWDKGFKPRFGLVEINYETLERKPRPSFFYYSGIAKNNYLTY